MTNNQLEKVTYLYCFSLASQLATPENAGIDETHPLFIVPHQEIGALVSEVALTDFVGAAAEAKMKDLTWIAPRALRHEAIIAQAMTAAPVLPARFGTLFSSPDELKKFIASHYQTILQFLRQTQGQQEFSVKGFLQRAPAQQRLRDLKTEQQQEQLKSISPGLRYFQEQKIKAEAEKELNQWLQEICANIGKELSKFAVDVRVRNVSNTNKNAGEPEVILHWAFLLTEKSSADFREQIDAINTRLSEHGLAFECTGPFPPFGFAPALTREQSA